MVGVKASARQSAATITVVLILSSTEASEQNFRASFELRYVREPCTGENSSVGAASRDLRRQAIWKNANAMLGCVSTGKLPKTDSRSAKQHAPESCSITTVTAAEPALPNPRRQLTHRAQHTTECKTLIASTTQVYKRSLRTHCYKGKNNGTHIEVSKGTSATAAHKQESVPKQSQRL